MRTLAFALFAASLFAAPASAQQTSASLNAGQLPAGISVIGTGSVRVAAWLQTNHFTARSAQAAESFENAVTAAGLPTEAVVVTPTDTGFLTKTSTVFDVAVTARLDLVPRLQTLARSHDLTVSQATELLPADAAALYQRALGLAVQDARQEAEAIAAADNQHIGKMINFMPSPGELARNLAAGSLAVALMGNSAGPGYVGASAIVTFALVP